MSREPEGQVIEIAGLPTIRVSRTKGTADFVTESIAIEVSGLSIEEARSALDYAISKMEDVK